jgi:regulation of enolase protein 1 (concanavalin A-like superfamily)
VRINNIPFDLITNHSDLWNYNLNERQLDVSALPRSDIYINPAGKNSADAQSLMNATTLLGVPPEGDYQFAARITVDFKSQYDAGVLLIWSDENYWAKFCFEYSPDSNPMVVSVVTLNVSDDANSFIVLGNSIWYRVSRQDHVYALHASLDGKVWQLIRVFTLGEDMNNHKVGFLAQSPTGIGCEIQFDEISFSQKRLIELRDGS